ncbi:hypothetical protein D039_0689A, partial [Vibrio parahaemolyticus EKP-028]
MTRSAKSFNDKVLSVCSKASSCLSTRSNFIS